MSTDFVDQGNVVSLSGAAILTTYVASTAIKYGDADAVRYTVKVVTGGGTAMTSLDVKIQASADNVTFYDIGSSNDITKAFATSHNQALSAGATVAFSVASDASFEWLRVAVKANGGAGSATDAVTVGAEQSDSPNALQGSASSTGGGATAANQALALVELDSASVTTAPLAVVVSTTAVKIYDAGVHAGRMSVNIGVSNIYVGKNATVTSSGVTAGHKLAPNGVYNDFGPGRSIDELWAISDAVSAVANLSKEQRTP